MDKIEKVVESKIDEITVKIDETLDKVPEVNIEEPTIIASIIDKIDDIPVVNNIIENVVEVVDGRSFTCSCWGWLFVLRISRKSQPKPPSKPEDTPNKSLSEPSQPTPPKEEPLPTSPPESQEHPAESS